MPALRRLCENCDEKPRKLRKKSSLDGEDRDQRVCCVRELSLEAWWWCVVAPVSIWSSDFGLKTGFDTVADSVTGSWLRFCESKAQSEGVSLDLFFDQAKCNNMITNDVR